MILGITGGTGGGKTTLLRQVEELGGLVIDCDELYHYLLDTNLELTKKLVSRFGDILTQGRLDRKKLGMIVFGDAQALLDLNAIAHDFVCQAVADILADTHDLVAIDAIGLIESGLGDLCDVTVCIIAPKEERVKRLMLREGISQEYAEKRISAQKSDEEFIKMCQHSLVNDTTRETFHQRCQDFLTAVL